MADNDFGNGVSRTLDAESRQFNHVVWQEGKPPLDSELNLSSQVQEEARRKLLQAGVPSGWVTDPNRPYSDWEFDQKASNLLWFGGDDDQGREVPHAIVNGWVIPVVGTLSSDFRNEIRLPPPDTSVSSSDVDFVFLEVWKALVDPDTDVNKPAVDKLYRFGNVDYGGTNLDDDMVDPEIGFETTNRVQLQYRIRVVDGIDPSAYPDGFNPSIKTRGPLDDPVSSTNDAYEYTNMGDEMGDPGLWRAGTGDPDNSLTETVDGYVWAVPMAMVFRRTDSSWSIVNQHGGFNRNPDATERSEATLLPTVTVDQVVEPGDTTIEVDTSQASTTFEQTPSSNRDLLRIGDEVVEYSDWTNTTITVSQRGARNTHATKHEVGTEVEYATDHPFGLYSDQIHSDDLLDIRHAVTFGEFDYQALLHGAFDKLVTGELSSDWKRSEGDVKGRKTYQVDFVSNQTPPPNGTIALDGPDGFRRVFSDACTLQPDNLLSAAPDSDSFSVTDYAYNPAAGEVWRSVDGEWNKGDVISVPLDQFRTTFSTSDDERVRAVHPFEYDDSDHDPFRLSFGETNPGSNNEEPILDVLTTDSGDVDPPISGTHDGSNDSQDLVDSTADFPTDGSIRGEYVYNDTDGSYGIIADVLDSNTIAFESPGLQGGTDDDFDSGDAYRIGAEPPFVVLGESPNDHLAKQDLGPLPTSLEGDSDSVHFDDGATDVIDVGVDFSQTYSDLGVPVANALASINAWIVVGNPAGTTTGNPENHGAFRITGLDGTALSVETARGQSPGFVSTTGSPETRDWAIRMQDCTKLDDEFYVAITRDWSELGVSAISTSEANVHFDMLYDPAQGLSRVPDDTAYIQLETPSSDNYVRENGFSNFIHSPGANAKKFDTLPYGKYPPTRSSQNIQPERSLLDEGHVAWGEAWIDRGSKTMLLEPYRQTEINVNDVNLPSSTSYSDNTNTFALQSSDPSYLLPSSVVPKPGRIDLPFVREQSTNNTDMPFGFNFLFRGAAAAGGTNTDVVAQNPGGGTAVFYVVYDPTEFDDNDWGDYVNLGNHGGPGGVDALVSRAYTAQDKAIGVELPAHYGVARLHGVYDFDQFTAQGGASGFDSGNEYRTENGTYDNLIREDDSKGVFHITQDNTFVIGEGAIDLNQVCLGSLNLDPCDFQDADPLIFELEMFMFEDFGDEDFVRIHTVDGETPQNDLALVTNGPVENTDSAYVVSERTPYQGNITKTMPGSTTDTSLLTPDDYIIKHGVETQSNIANALSESLTPQNVRTPNEVELEVLAARPFATTLGSGMLSGEAVAGEFSDVGYLDLASYPYTDVSDLARVSKTRSHATAPDGQPTAREAGGEFVGVTERLPMGIAYADYQFTGEEINEEGLRFWTPDLSIEGAQSHIVDQAGAKFLSGGDLVFSDGTSLGSNDRTGFDAVHDLYRTHRGGAVRRDVENGSEGHVALHGGRAGKNLDFLDSPRTDDLKMHGAILFGVALLVRDHSRSVTDNDYHFSSGGELQMLVLSSVVPGNETIPDGWSREMVEMYLEMHPRGIGEGTAAADLYRLDGRPLVARSRQDATSTTDTDDWTLGG